jgi:hypothetical protein
MSGRMLLLMVLVLAQTVNAQNAVVWSGGIGVDERAAAPATGTKLVFTAKQGNFLANVHVTIKDAHGKVVVDTVSPGPWLILDLPAGSYHVRAEVDGKVQGMKMTVGEKKQYIISFAVS